MSRARLDRRIGQQTPLYGTLVAVEGSSGAVTSMWLGALTHDGVSAVVQMAAPSTIVLDVLVGASVVASVGPLSTGANNVVRFDVTGLSANTAHTCRVRNAVGTNNAGAFTTLPTTPGVAASFLCAFAGDADTGSNHVSFDAVRASGARFFIHGGDLHYLNITSNNAALYHSAYNQVLALSRQGALARAMPWVYVWDDHDGAGGNNSNGSAVAWPAAASAYRDRVPHYPLVESTSIYHSFDVGRVRFIVTDQRSAADPNSDTDDSNKTMLGATQKAWFFDLLANSPGKLIVWVCPRHFASGTSAGHDSWGGFSNERAQIGAQVAAHCAGRFVAISFDVHVLGIDDGSNRTFGGASIPTFQAAPLDQGSSFPGDTFSEGGFGGNGQWGTMQVTDAGGSTIDVEWTGYDSAGGVLVTYSFSVSV